MDKVFSTFVDNKYYWDFVALYNSYVYYDHKTPFKVYISGPLDNDRRKKIEKYCEVIDDPVVQLPENRYKYIFKFIALINNMANKEIFVDTDTLFLNNADHLFDYLDNGKLVVAEESNANVFHKYWYTGDWQAEHLRIQNHLRQYIGNYADNFVPDCVTPNYNMGLLGLCKDKHKFLLEKSVELLKTDFQSEKNCTFQFEQFMFNLMVQMYNVDKQILPQAEWMNTWTYHSTPKKYIGIEDKKFKVFDENNLRVNFYHFTAGFSFIENDHTYGVKPHMLMEPEYIQQGFTRKKIEDCYYVTNQNPILLLYEYFVKQEF
jgi:hypothetical protein